MKITLREIARKSGLSASLLSRVLSGNGYVAPQKREMALRVLAESGYQRAKPRPRERLNMEDTILVISGSTGNTYQETIRALTAAARKRSKKS